VTTTLVAFTFDAAGDEQMTTSPRVYDAVVAATPWKVVLILDDRIGLRPSGSESRPPDLAASAHVATGAGRRATTDWVATLSR
jgi:hypothetical protein